MIGTRIRGFRHLIRIAKTLSEVQIFFKVDYIRICGGVALYVKSEDVKNPFMMSNGDYLLIFNDSVSNISFDISPYKKNGELYKKVNELINKLGNVWVIPVNKKNFLEDSILSQVVVVPNDFEEKYKEFCEANKKQMPNATKYDCINSSVFKYLYAITNGSKNFFFWAVKAYFKQNMSVYLLEKIMIWNDGYSQLASKLKKGTITAYTNLSEFFDLVREMTKLRRDKRANDVISMFNTAQKKALKNYTLSERDYDTLSKFGKLSCKKKNNFIRKMSTIEDPCEILKQMSFLADVHFEWKKESLLEFLKNSDGFKCEVVIDKGDMVLLKVDDYETVKRLAKTTNWCISKDKKYWNEYVENNPNATQYVLMDFSRKEDDNLSIVGFTSVHDKGITNAHDFQNKNLMKGKRVDTISEIKSFVSKVVDCSNIYGVLDKYGIKLSDVVSYEPNPYKWDRESVFNYLEQCVDDFGYYIIYDDGNRVAFISDDNNIKYFLGDAYMDQQGVENDVQYIIFADFTKKENDPEKLIFGIIKHNFNEHESSCARLYNERYEAINQSFDSKLEEYGLPYDVICRKGNVVERFFNALSSLELATAKDLINDDKVKSVILSRERGGIIRDCIYNVTFAYKSADYINLFYNAGYKLSDILSTRVASDFAIRMINTMHETALRHGFNPNVPSVDEVNALKDYKIKEYDKALYIGNFLMLMKMLDEETNISFTTRVIECVLQKGCVSDLYDLLMVRAINAIKNAKAHSALKNIVSYAYGLGSPIVINALNSDQEVASFIEDFISSETRKRIENKLFATEMWVRNVDGMHVKIDTKKKEEVSAVKHT